jgi:4,5-DOPA dioxygenase extradiol
MPVLFVGHGSPMNAIEDNLWGRGWHAMAAELPPPRAIVCVSAHWYVRGTFVTGEAAPKTIHDFGGFPRALFEVQYPARGDSALATQIASMLAGAGAATSTAWGLDHGTWSVLVKMYPAAEVPVLQVSIDRACSPAQHLAIGRALGPLREQGVLVIGSGNITHNLAHALRWDGREQPSWALQFDAEIARALEQHDEAFLVRALETDAGKRSHPTIEHYVPLLYAAGAAGAAGASDRVAFPVQGFDLGSLSMRSVRFG